MASSDDDLDDSVAPPVTEATDAPMFQDVINQYCRVAELLPPTEIDLVPRLFRAARYRFGRYIETVIGAIEYALNERAPRLDMNHFAWFWGMQEGCVTCPFFQSHS